MTLRLLCLILILGSALAKGGKFEYTVVEKDSGRKIEGLSVKVERKGNELVFRLFSSVKHPIAVSKLALSWSVDMGLGGKSKPRSHGNGHAVAPSELDHVILNPGSSMIIYRIPSIEDEFESFSYKGSFGMLGVKKEDYAEALITVELGPPEE